MKETVGMSQLLIMAGIVVGSIILLYLLLELFLDYIFIIPFRDILALHIIYIVVFYAAEFSMIGVSFNKNKKMGFVLLVTFGVLIGCLIYMYVG